MFNLFYLFKRQKVLTAILCHRADLATITTLVQATFGLEDDAAIEVKVTGSTGVSAAMVSPKARGKGAAKPTTPLVTPLSEGRDNEDTPAAALRFRPPATSGTAQTSGVTWRGSFFPVTRGTGRTGQTSMP